MFLSKKFLKIFLVLALFSISYTLTSMYILYSQYSTALPDLWHNAMDIIAPDFTSCYYTINEGSFLHLIDDTPKPNNSIFFHEITCQWSLGIRQACSVESAARAHPDSQVYVIFTRGLTVTDCHSGTLAELRKLSNIHFYRVDLNSYALGTPLQNVFMARLTKLGKWHYRRIGEFLKFLTLYKFGGVVVDLDMMVVGPLNNLGHNWVSKESGETLESGIISVSHDQFGKYFSHRFLRALKEQAANGEENGGPALNDALKSLCNSTDDVRGMMREKCKGFNIYSEEFFNPGNNSWEEYSKAPSSIDQRILGYHLWDESPQDHKLMPSNSLFASLAKQHCPYVFSRFMDTTNNEGTIHL